MDDVWGHNLKGWQQQIFNANCTIGFFWKSDCTIGSPRGLD